MSRFKRLTVTPAPNGAQDADGAYLLNPATLDLLVERQSELTRIMGFIPTFDQVMAHALTNMTKLSHLPTAGTVSSAADGSPADVTRLLAEARAQDEMRRGDKIMAIKVMREATAMGLKEAKDYVEKYWEHLRPPR